MTLEQFNAIKERISDDKVLCASLDSLYDVGNRAQQTISGYFSIAQEAENKSYRIELDLQRRDSIEYPG